MRILLRILLPSLAVVLGLGTVGCSVNGPTQTKLEQPTTGSLDLGGPLFGAQTLSPTLCDSGQHELFLGADFSSPSSPLVTRLVVDPLNGPGVRVFDREARFTRALVFRQEHCATFHFSLGQKNWRLNDIDLLEVQLELDCVLPSGDTLRGKVQAATCW